MTSILRQKTGRIPFKETKKEEEKEKVPWNMKGAKKKKNRKNAIMQTLKHQRKKLKKTLRKYEGKLDFAKSVFYS